MVWIVICSQVIWRGAAGAEEQKAARPQTPNIVLLIADDLGYGELGCQGNPEIPTVSIDALAETGVRCTQFYVTAPNCSPSRAGLLTGRIPTRFGYEWNPIGARNEEPGVGLPAAETTLAEFLQDHGYTTALIGKWHLGGSAAYHPQRHGFDYFFGFTHEGHYYAPAHSTETVSMLRRKTLPLGHHGRFYVRDDLIYTDHMGHNEPDYDANNPIVRNGQPSQLHEYLTDTLAEEAVSFIDRYAGAPFFLTVSFNAVHSPLQAKKTTLAELEHIRDIHRRIFAAMLLDLDRAVGRIVAALNNHGIRENTLVVFLSDNGGPTKELTSSNRPLRGGKGTMYEGGLRVPCIFNWPGVLPAGSVRSQILSSLDLFPTLGGLIQADMSNLPLDGSDAWSILKDNAAASVGRVLYWRQGGRAALRRGDWKLVAPNSSRNSRPPNRVWELYNIAEDLSEQRNLAAERPDVLQQLLEAWQAMDREMADPLF